MKIILLCCLFIPFSLLSQGGKTKPNFQLELRYSVYNLALNKEPTGLSGNWMDLSHDPWSFGTRRIYEGSNNIALILGYGRERVKAHLGIGYEETYNFLAGYSFYTPTLPDDSLGYYYIEREVTQTTKNISFFAGVDRRWNINKTLFIQTELYGQVNISVACRQYGEHVYVLDGEYKTDKIDQMFVVDNLIALQAGTGLMIGANLFKGVFIKTGINFYHGKIRQMSFSEIVDSPRLQLRFPVVLGWDFR